MTKTTSPPYDPRSVANLMLDEADRVGISVSHISLQKLLYFAHGLYLNATKAPLVSGYFEAWKYGPVHPTVFQAFKSAGAEPISFRAKGRNALTGQIKEIGEPGDPQIRQHIQQVLLSYGRLSSGRLVEISHAKRSPWDFIVDKSRTSVAFGLRIPDDVILERFKHHKIAVGETPSTGEPSEDTPLA
ncbi:type VI toxin-antitoxin system SocA family antitoxin [Rhizobium rosettiformans]|uniref:type VI toxin-antitoxin system SocA family antitoxin n=1 Tax=Rhizobium rosettiformans TaxID=1368430 RepID=UPI002861CD20|nr:Panacea domain-containing protein [Rhizobium rosettiformans]MDR7028017.1 putative phage-associated protein [Rhizobium rosettiformans]MDR7064701.1 putative phage-associated protein [Rhizobium rosettiformans]